MPAISSSKSNLTLQAPTSLGILIFSMAGMPYSHCVPSTYQENSAICTHGESFPTFKNCACKKSKVQTIDVSHKGDTAAASEALIKLIEKRATF